MATKKNIQKKKPARKPLDEFASIKALVRREVKRIEAKVDLADSRLRTLNAWEQMQEAMADASPSPDPDALKPEPKFNVGDWVRNTDNGEVGTIREASTSRCINMVIGGDDGPTRTYLQDWLERLSPAEVSAYQEAERVKEWEGRTEFNINDACRATLEERREILAIITNTGIQDGFGTKIEEEDFGWVLYRKDINDGPRIGWDSIDSHLVGTYTFLPFPVFKRLLIAEVERKKAEREEEERSKPVNFGDRVKVTGLKAVHGDTAILHHLNRKNGNEWWAIFPDGSYDTIPRSEFTVLPK